MVSLRYRIVDVFSERPLAGNALCVVLDPCPEPVMAAIAREVNLSETTFPTVVGDGAYDVRIFTPAQELPFAGHPTLGTAWVLGPGRWQQTSPGATVVVEADETGAVLHQADPALTETYPEEPAAALGLTEAAVRQAFVAEVGGIRHVIAPTEAAIDRLRPDMAAVTGALAPVRATGLAVIRPGPGDRGGDRVQARVFVTGIGEDPGTGSAAAGIAFVARRLWGFGDEVTIDQGMEMGRPCRIEVHAEPGAVRVGGRVTACADGRFTL